MSTIRIKAFVEMTKPSINGLVLVTTFLGYYLAKGSFQRLDILAWVLIGSALSCAGAAVLNQYLERDSDVLMDRTKNRPLPKGIITPHEALSFGIVLVLFGVGLLCWKVNLLTGFLSLLTCFLYVLVYTPMKKMSWLNTTIGAIPGAIPPLGGWAAATNSLDLGGWALFLILFAWQHPHFYAIAWMLKDDYKKARFKMLPVVYPDGRMTFAQIMAFSFALIGFSILPSMIGLSGKIYFWGVLLIGLIPLYTGWMFCKAQSNINARNVLLSSVIYLPLLLGVIILDTLLKYAIL